MNTSITQLFVYGSLRSGFRNPAYQYLSRYFSLAGPAVVKGKLFDKGTYPVAKATTEEKYIIGELYVINNPEEFSWIIEQLDDYEGVNGEEGEKPLYKRETVVAYQNNKPIEAWIYWYDGEVNGLPEIASGDVLQYSPK